MVLEINDECEFTPEWNGNKGADKPILVKYKAPTMPMYDKLIPKPQLMLKVSPEGKAMGGETTVTVDNKAIIFDMVTSIENFDVKLKSGNTLNIRTGKDLYGAEVPAVVSGLVDEIGSHLQATLSKRADISTKNSE